jgi:hypothetical protein
MADARGLRTLLVCLLGGTGAWSQALEASRSAAATGITRALANKPRHARPQCAAAMRVALCVQSIFFRIKKKGGGG